MSAEPSYASADLTDYVRVVSRRRWIVVGTAVGLAVLAFLYASTRGEEFTTGTSLEYVAPDPERVQNPSALASYIQDETAFLKSVTVAQRAAEIMGTSRDPRALLRDVTVVVPQSGRVVTVRATTPTAATAQATAQAFADAYIDLRGETAQAELDRQLEIADRQIASLREQRDSVGARLETACAPGQPASVCTSLTLEYSRVDDQVRTAENDREELASTPLDSGTILSPAPLPREPSTPSATRTAVLGLLAGVVVGLIVAFVYDRFDSRVRDKGEIEAAIGLTPLASIPLFAEQFRSRSAALVTATAADTPEADSFRRLRASVLIAMEDIGGTVLGLTSANPGEGKSTVSANLAVTLSQAGHRTVVLSADVRRPSLEQLFSLPPGPGLGEILERKATLDEAITLKSSTLAVLRSGQADGNPSDLLVSPRMASLIRTLREQWDYVIVDTPPVLAVADTLGMVGLVDAMAVVVSLDNTTSAEASDAEEQLRRVGAPLIGAVINRAASTGQRYYGYRT